MFFGWLERWFIWRGADEWIAPWIFPSWRQRRNYYRDRDGNTESSAQPVTDVSEAEEEIRELRQR